MKMCNFFFVMNFAHKLVCVLYVPVILDFTGFYSNVCGSAANYHY